MDLIKFREYCLSLGEVEEKIPFEKFSPKFDSLLVFYVGGHMFCMTDIKNFKSVEVRTTPEREAELKDKYTSVGKPLNPTLKYWIDLELGGDIPDGVILDLVKESYEIVKAHGER